MGHLAHNHFFFRSRLVDICMYDCTCLYANETTHTTYSLVAFGFTNVENLKVELQNTILWLLTLKRARCECVLIFIKGILLEITIPCVAKQTIYTIELYDQLAKWQIRAYIYITSRISRH